MASLVKTYSSEKLRGQVYTPDFIVVKMLDDIGFDSSEMLGKTILDPACGDGRFLEEIVGRILAWSEPEDLEQHLSFVHGWDIDDSALEICREHLDQLVGPFGLEIAWNLTCLNALQKLPQTDLFSTQTIDNQRFEFIVGNPPYIRIQHLEEAQRRFIQARYRFCKCGSTDIFIAFFELAVSLLAENGVCGFITPNTFFNTEAGRELRQFFGSHKNLRQLTNYGDLQLFENATTYSAITIFGKSRQPDFRFEMAFTKADFLSRRIPFEELNGEKFWQLSAEKPLEKRGRKLREICKIHVGITTLCDRAYFFQAQKLDDDFFLADTKLAGPVRLEAGILKPILKASTLKSADDPIREFALFPYHKINGKHTLIEEKTLKTNYPLAYEYLSSIKDVLACRDNGRPVAGAWFGYGRTQSLDSSFGKKILFSAMAARPNFIPIDHEGCTFYAGYCIKFDGDTDWLLGQLNSPEMAEFIAVSSRDFRGGWKAYNKKIVEEFYVDWPPNG